MAPARHRRRQNQQNQQMVIDLTAIDTASGPNSTSAVAARGPNSGEWVGDSCKFDTEVPTEVKNITWLIKSFSTMSQLKNLDGDKRKKHVIKFNAGEAVDLPSSWKMEVSLGSDNNVGLYLSLLEYRGITATIVAKFDSSVKSPCGTKDIVSRSLVPTDMKAVPDWGWRNFISDAQLKEGGGLVNDSLTINIKFILFGKKTVNTISPLYATTSLERQSKDEVLEHLGSILESGDGSDFAIRVPKSNEVSDYATVKVHKSVLAARSPVFQAMFESQMMESRNAEVTIEDMHLKTLKMLMKFVYTGSIDEEWKAVAEELVYAADKYSIPLLKQHCDKELHNACNAGNAFNLLKVAKKHGLAIAKRNIGKFIKSNIHEIIEKA